MSEEYWIIAFCPTDGNWYILDSRDMSKVAGPYETHDDIVDGIRTRHWRISRGWAP